MILDDEITRLLTFPNVLVTSHQAFLTHEALHEIARVTADNIRNLGKCEPFLPGLPFNLFHQVNLSAACPDLQPAFILSSGRQALNQLVSVYSDLRCPADLGGGGDRQSSGLWPLFFVFLFP